MNNYEKIKNMSVKEMAEYLAFDGACGNKIECEHSCLKCITLYLQQEEE